MSLLYKDKLVAGKPTNNLTKINGQPQSSQVNVFLPTKNSISGGSAYTNTVLVSGGDGKAPVWQDASDWFTHITASTSVTAITASAKTIQTLTVTIPEGYAAIFGQCGNSNGGALQTRFKGWKFPLGEGTYNLEIGTVNAANYQVDNPTIWIDMVCVPSTMISQITN